VPAWTVKLTPLMTTDAEVWIIAAALRNRGCRLLGAGRGCRDIDGDGSCANRVVLGRRAADAPEHRAAEEQPAHAREVGHDSGRPRRAVEQLLRAELGLR
jgi:hypothetical protein